MILKMNIDQIIFFALMFVFFFGSAFLFFICGLDFTIGLFCRINRIKMRKFKWTKTKAKIANIKIVPRMNVRGSRDRLSYTVIYYAENVRYKKSVIDPDMVLQGKYVYLYYKNNNPEYIKPVSRPTQRNMLLAVFLYALSGVLFISGYLIISNLI